MEYVRRGGYTCASVQAWDTLRYVVMSSLQLNLHAERVFKCALIEYGVVWEHSLKHAVVEACEDATHAGKDATNAATDATHVAKDATHAATDATHAAKDAICTIATCTTATCTTTTSESNI